MEKKKLFILVTIAILIFTILTGIVYAKMISDISGTAEIEIAKWSFLVNDKDGSEGESLGEIDLGKTSYTADTISNEKIAPGTSGSFDIVINATGTEVAIDYSIEVSNVENKPENLYFVVDGTKFSTLEEMCETLKGRINANDTNKVISKTIDWAWDYETEISVDGTRTTIEANDLVDIENCKSAQKFAFTLTITGVQTKPEK